MPTQLEGIAKIFFARKRGNGQAGLKSLKAEQAHTMIIYGRISDTAICPKQQICLRANEKQRRL